MTLRLRLLLQTLAVLVPSVLFGAVVSAWLVQREQRVIEQSVRDRVRTLHVAVANELRASIESAGVLAVSDALRRSDLDAFHREIAAAVRTHPNWQTVNLVAPDGRQLLSSAREPGAPLPPVADLESVVQAFRGGRPVVSDLVRGPITGELRVGVRVPVHDGGSVTHVITVAIRPDVWSTLLASLNLPAGWIAVVVDRQGRVLARSSEPDRFVGTTIGEAARDTMLGPRREGWASLPGRDGVPVHAAWERLAEPPWTVALALPNRLLHESGWRTFAVLGTAAVIAFAVAALLAWRNAGRVASPVRTLAEQARRVARGEAPARLESDRPRADVSEVKELEESLQLAWAAIAERDQQRRRVTDELRRLDRTKDEFLAMLGHELRNPLGALTSAAFVLRRAVGTSSAAAQALAITDRQLEHVSRIVNDMLDLNQIVLGRAAMRFAPTDLARIVDEQLETFRAQGRIAGHRVDVDLRPAWAMADPSRIAQVVGNLLDNAVKFTPAGGAIALRTRTRGGEAVVEVADTGRGIDAELAPHVFGLFVQGERDLARTEGGFGIGLAVVERIVAAHGGTVALRSEGPGRGARFTVSLPSCPPAGPSVPADASDAPGRSARILVVEDNEDVRESLVSWLRMLGHDVLSAVDGETGAEVAIRECPELALIDIGLPRRDGYDVARAIRASECGPRIQLVALTGYGDLSRERSTDAGFDGHLTKPLTEAQLRAILAPRRAA